MSDAEHEDLFRVVINESGQYSILRDALPNPSGWFNEGKTGSKDACLDHIELVWTDVTFPDSNT